MNNMKVKYSFAEWCKDNNHQDWLDLWDHELNDILPDSVSYKTSKKYWFQCNRGLHGSEQRIPKLLVNGESRVCCRMCNSIGQFLLDKYGDEAIDKMWSDKNTIDPFLIAKNAKRIKVWLKCTQHNHPDSDFIPTSVVQGSVCKSCSGCSIVTGYNDIATTYPEYVKYFLNIEDSYNTSRWTEKQVSVVCPDCGHIMKKRVCDLISYPFNCKRCGDKSTYPNKYMYEFLSQLSEIHCFDIHPEHVFEWSRNLSQDNLTRRIYDFFLQIGDRHIIVEVHGEQHFNGSFCMYPGARTVQDEIDNDAYKKSLAISNGVLDCDYIVIDARKSDPEWIKNSIFGSGIKNIFPFNEEDINWTKCDELACKNLVKTVSELWNSGIKNTSAISQSIGKTVNTTIVYLKRASNLGWCDYTPWYIKKHSRQAILCLDNNMAFESAHICSRCSENVFGEYLNTNAIQTAASKNRRYRGYLFKFITKEEIDEHHKQYPELTFIGE